MSKRKRPRYKTRSNNKGTEAYEFFEQQATKREGLSNDGIARVNAHNIKNHYFEHLYDMVLQRYKWNGFPTNFPTYVIEKFIIEKGGVFVRHHPDFKDQIQALTVTPNLFNEYDEPISANVTMPRSKNNGEEVLIYNTEEYTEGMGVFITGNARRSPIINIIEYYAEKLMCIKVTQEINLNAQKHPVILLADEYNLKSLQNFWDQFDSDNPVITVDQDKTKQISLKDSVAVLDIKAPYNIDKLQTYLEETWGSAMTRLDFMNLEVKKKERLTVGENSSNDEQIAAVSASNLMFRELGAMRLSQILKTEISVERRILTLDRGETDVLPKTDNSSG